MDGFKRCKQCGEIRLLDMFRPYYKGLKGTYNMCKFCESENSREKYLRGKEIQGSLTAAQQRELQDIHDLWELRREEGLRPPNSPALRATVAERTAIELEKKRKEIQELKASAIDYKIPTKLQYWLDAPLTDSPEYYNDVADPKSIMNQLEEEFKPVIGFDKETALPIYDRTHIKALNQISARFDDYEDNYEW